MMFRVALASDDTAKMVLCHDDGTSHELSPDEISAIPSMPFDLSTPVSIGGRKLEIADPEVSQDARRTAC